MQRGHTNTFKTLNTCKVKLSGFVARYGDKRNKLKLKQRRDGKEKTKAQRFNDLSANPNDLSETPNISLEAPNISLEAPNISLETKKEIGISQRILPQIAQKFDEEYYDQVVDYNTLNALDALEDNKKKKAKKVKTQVQHTKNKNTKN